MGPQGSACLSLRSAGVTDVHGHTQLPFALSFQSLGEARGLVHARQVPFRWASMPSCTAGFYVGSGDQAEVLILAHQKLHPLSLPPHPTSDTFVLIFFNLIDLSICAESNSPFGLSLL